MNENEEKEQPVEEKAASNQNPETESAEEKKPEEAAEMTDLQKIEALTKENADLKDQLLRRAADFDNYRKRTIQEKQEAYDYANTNLLKDLLDTIDNFERALQAADKAEDIKTVVDGIKMVSGNLVSLLENKYNLESYGNAGDAFNPDEHEAIGSMQGPVASPVIKEVFLKGYKLKGRVIRNAKVMVTMPDGTVEAPAEEKSEKPETEKESEK